MWGLVWLGCGLIEALRYEPTPVPESQLGVPGDDGGGSEAGGAALFLGGPGW